MVRNCELFCANGSCACTGDFVKYIRPDLTENCNGERCSQAGYGNRIYSDLVLKLLPPSYHALWFFDSRLQRIESQLLCVFTRSVPSASLFSAETAELHGCQISNHKTLKWSKQPWTSTRGNTPISYTAGFGEKEEPFLSSVRIKVRVLRLEYIS